MGLCLTEAEYGAALRFARDSVRGRRVPAVISCRSVYNIHKEKTKNIANLPQIATEKRAPAPFFRSIGTSPRDLMSAPPERFL